VTVADALTGTWIVNWDYGAQQPGHGCRHRTACQSPRPLPALYAVLCHVAVNSLARINTLSLGLALLCLLLFCPPGEPAPPVFTLAFGGDVMLGRGVLGLDGVETAFAQVRPWLAGADLPMRTLNRP
jgi:hypothetical protein